MQDLRIAHLTSWLSKQFKCQEISIEPLDGDAGFRRYFRALIKGQFYIAVDAPTQTCNNEAFIEIARKLAKAGVKTPQIHRVDLKNGWLCLEDFGNELLIDSLNENTATAIYQDAIEPLSKFTHVDTTSLPLFDEAFIRRELNIFSQWLLKEHLGIDLSEAQQCQWHTCQTLLVESALAQPTQFMHRDYHSRNIMRCQDQSLGIIDFQDAVLGPMTYDIVSLLKDCYIKWPREQVLSLFHYYLAQLPSEITSPYSIDQWIRWFDLMGMQRHLKACGIFARLHHRDKKHHYLKDIPLTLTYILDVAADYPTFSFLSELIESIVLPQLKKLEVETS